jgi:hypothetical protein
MQKKEVLRRTSNLMDLQCVHVLVPLRYRINTANLLPSELFKVLRKFEFEIQFLNLLGKPSLFHGYRGNGESRAPLGFF